VNAILISGSCGMIGGRAGLRGRGPGAIFTGGPL